MSKKLVVQYPQIGEVQFVPSAIAKYIRISLKPLGGIRVTVPRRASIRMAMAFVETKIDWIVRAQSRIAAHENQYNIFTPEIINTIRKEAKAYLPQRTEQLATKHGFRYRGVTVKNLSSRWGSCSAINHINLNIHLVRLPQYLSDYVILHELTHTVHKNHSDLFWQSLNMVTDGKAKQLAAEMKQYRTQLQNLHRS